MLDEPVEKKKKKRHPPRPRRAPEGGKYPHGARLAPKISYKLDVKVARTFATISNENAEKEFRGALKSSDEKVAELYDYLAPKVIQVVIKKLKRDYSTPRRLRQRRLSPRVVSFSAAAVTLATLLDALTPVDNADIQRLFIRRARRPATWLEKNRLTVVLEEVLSEITKIHRKIAAVIIAPHRPVHDEWFDEQLAIVLAKPFTDLTWMSTVKRGDYYAFLRVFAGRFSGVVTVRSYVTRPKGLPDDQTSSIDVIKIQGSLNRAIKLIPREVARISLKPGADPD